MQVLSLIASRLTVVVFVCFFSLLTFGQSAAQESNETDYKIQGEYTGTLDVEGQKVKFAIQVIALGKEKFTGVAYVGGLPGDGWDGEDTPPVENIALSDDEDKILNSKPMTVSHLYLTASRRSKTEPTKCLVI